MKLLVFIAASTGLMFCLAATGASAADLPDAGDLAPDFELPGSDGKTYRLADFRNKQVVVIAWYPKAFTGG